MCFYFQISSVIIHTMSYFSSLSSMDQQLEKLAQKRHSSGQQYRENGLRHLAFAAQEGFRNKSHLKDSFRELVRAIQHNRADADAYLGLVYLQLLVGDKPMALRYLQEGMRVAPEHADLQALFQDLTSPLATSPSAQDHENALYDTVCQSLKTQQQCLLVLQSMPVPCLDFAELSTYQKLYQERLAFQTPLVGQMDDLEQELDISSLRRQFQGLDGLLRLVRTHLDISLRFQVLAREINTLSQDVSRSFGELGMMVPQGREQQIERFYDHCDRIADQLDTFDHQGYAIGGLTPDYEFVVQQLETYAERIDELATNAH